MPKRKTPENFYVRATLCLPPDDLQILDAMATEAGLSRGKMLSQILNGLKNGKPPKKEK